MLVDIVCRTLTLNLCSSSSLRVWRSLSTSAKARAAAAAATQADGAAAPPPAAAGASSSSSNAQVNKIVDDISKLTLLEAADLVETLKVRSTRLFCSALRSADQVASASYSRG